MGQGDPRPYRAPVRAHGMAAAAAVDAVVPYPGVLPLGERRFGTNLLSGPTATDAFPEPSD